MIGRLNCGLRGSMVMVALSVSLVGCNDGKHPVKCMVLLNNQAVPNGKGNVTFTLVDAQDGQPQAARATIMPDGSYVLTTEELGDGAIPGRYHVTVILQEQPPKGDIIGATMPSLIPRKYAERATSGLQFTIPDDISPEGTIDLLLEGEGEPQTTPHGRFGRVLTSPLPAAKAARNRAPVLRSALSESPDGPHSVTT